MPSSEELINLFGRYTYIKPSQRAYYIITKNKRVGLVRVSAKIEDIYWMDYFNTDILENFYNYYLHKDYNREQVYLDMVECLTNTLEHDGFPKCDVPALVHHLRDFIDYILDLLFSNDAAWPTSNDIVSPDIYYEL